MRTNRRMGTPRPGRPLTRPWRLRRRLLPLLALTAAACTGLAVPGPAAGAAPAHAASAAAPAAPTFDLPAAGGAYSLLDGPESANGAAASVDLAGQWAFTPAGQSPTTIEVPGGGWYKQGFTNVAEATYSRQITIPDTGRPQVDKIIFGAVNHQATLYVDGTKVATNTTSFTPSTFDLTPYVQPGHTYTISVDVKGRKALINPANGKYLVPEAASWSPNNPEGIFRSAYLRVYPQVYIAGTAIRTSVTDRTLRYDTSITNTGGTPQTVTLTGHLTSWNHTGWTYPDIAGQRVTVPANATQDVTVTVPWTLGPASYWWPNVPYRPGYRAQLHLLHLAVHGADGLEDDAVYRFGFREVDQKDPYYYLNGVRVNFRGDDLAGSNYDTMDFHGQSDAFDTYPGFLPPSSSNPGWPAAVNNYERLNYNFVRIHQEPATPYMLNVADEMGLMVMDESPIRGSEGAEDFVTGLPNMVNNVRDLAIRDRNHPSVVRWSQANEPNYDSTDSQQFEDTLYHAIMAVDPTRPISIDTGGLHDYPGMTYANFNEIPHYLGLDTVVQQHDRPFGQGEFIWPESNKPQGFEQFATGTESMRAQNASDIRPYALLDGWVSLIPGVQTTDMTTDVSVARPVADSYPLYGADNLPNPWANPQIQRIQAAFNPVLVADQDYWNASKSSDAAGDWPVQGQVPEYGYGQPATRTLDIFNDTFAGTKVGVTWQVRAGSPTGPITADGSLDPTVPLGTHVQQAISFTTPTSGSRFYLVIEAEKNGRQLFAETGEYFTLSAHPTTSIDDTAAGTGTDQFNYVGGWGHASGEGSPANPYDGTNSYDATAGDYATMTFTGTQIAYYAVTDVSCGIAAVSIDGGPETPVDLYSPSRTGNALVWTSPVLPDGTHTLKIRVTGTKNPASSYDWVTIDRAEITS